MRSDSLGLFWYDEPPPKKEPKEKIKVIPPEPIWLKDDYLPGLEEAQNATYNLFTDSELSALPANSTFLFDIESYKNYFLAAFKEIESGKLVLFELSDTNTYDHRKLMWLLKTHKTVGFNSLNYDIPITTLACYPQYKNTAILKIATNLSILERYRPHDIYREFKLKGFQGLNHIDIKEVLPLNGGLKVYAGRIHAPKIQGLPFHAEAILSYHQQQILKFYCINDLLDTELLYKAINKELDLRIKMSSEYGVDLRSKSDAQIAETIITKRVEAKTQRRIIRPQVNVGARHFYKAPFGLEFVTPYMRGILHEVKTTPFVVGDSGKIKLPRNLSKLVIEIGESKYKFGIGGLHSKEKSVSYKAENGKVLRDIDATSFYPYIIINQKLEPEALKGYFLSVYKKIVEERVRAKQIKDTVTSDILKIAINGSFGKFGSKYSVLYSPNFVIQTTITGQLYLLMLIEMLELSGVKVVSANTDGIVTYANESQQWIINKAIQHWGNVTRLKTEDTYYKAIYCRDVNNYIAIKTDNSAKLKGYFGKKGLSKNPVNEVCVQAIIKNLLEGATVEDTINNNDKFGDFVNLRKVKGGAYKDGQFYGEVIRYYHSNNSPGPIIYAETGNMVPISIDCAPIPVFPKNLPDDLDKSWYISETYKMMKKIGALST